MRILMVSLYPPVRDGIAAYAVQAVARLRREDHDVEVLSPGPSAAHHHLDLLGPRGAAALAKRVRGYDKIVVQFHPDVFYPVPASSTARVTESVALGLAFTAAREVEVRVHEIDYEWGRGNSAAALACRALWQTVDKIVVHTEAERDRFADAFRVAHDSIAVEPHGAHFLSHVTNDRAAARRRLGIPDDQLMFLAIGFIQPHKGFDRAIRAFAGADPAACRLDIVGSVRIEEPAYVEHLEEVLQMAATTPGVDVHVGYLSDADFDRWVVACDVVVLPYRSIWSSGVMERAALYERPVIATRVGGLADQAAGRSGITIVEDDTELAVAVRSVIGDAAGAVEHDPWPSHVADRDSIQAEIQARAAAMRPSPGGDATATTLTHRRDASAPLRRVHPLALPPPTSAGFGRGVIKHLVRRATAWQIDPLVHQLNSVHDAAIQSVERVPPEDGVVKG